MKTKLLQCVADKLCEIEKTLEDDCCLVTEVVDICAANDSPADYPNAGDPAGTAYSAGDQIRWQYVADVNAPTPPKLTAIKNLSDGTYPDAFYYQLDGVDLVGSHPPAGDFEACQEACCVQFEQSVTLDDGTDILYCQTVITSITNGVASHIFADGTPVDPNVYTITPTGDVDECCDGYTPPNPNPTAPANIDFPAGDVTGYDLISQLTPGADATSIDIAATCATLAAITSIYHMTFNGMCMFDVDGGPGQGSGTISISPTVEFTCGTITGVIVFQYTPVDNLGGVGPASTLTFTCP